ncbi:glycosyltransferase family 9 protein [Povalibacter sp.]|uniref:glycosyltransferase family 9 protein n=1 Tax=Povalibacter sp. TaxID=1962978 RepID=UPI002F419AE4
MQFVDSRSPATQRVLIVRFGALGDMVLLTPMIRRLHERFGVPVDIVSSGGWTRPLLDGQPGVGDIRIIGSRRRPYLLSPDQQRLVRWLRARGPTPTWFAHPHDVGRDLLRRGNVPDEFVCDFTNTIPGEHDADRWVRFADETPVALGNVYPPAQHTRSAHAFLQVTASMRSDLQPWLVRHGLESQSLIAIQAGNKRTMRSWKRRRVTNKKYWPETRWAQVIRAVRKDRPHSAIVLLGVPQEHELNQDIIREAGITNIHNVANDLPVPILVALLERTDSMISVDTGPAHVAAAVGCSVVTLFADADPQRYRPGGRNTFAIALQGKVEGQLNILGIDASRVIAAWRQLPKRARRYGAEQELTAGVG